MLLRVETAVLLVLHSLCPLIYLKDCVYAEFEEYSVKV